MGRRVIGVVSRPCGPALRRLAWLLLLFAVAGCGEGESGRPAAQGEDSSMALIKGQVIYRERMMLPPEAEIEVQLQDISRADAMATIIATVLLRQRAGHPTPSVSSTIRPALTSVCVTRSERRFLSETSCCSPILTISIRSAMVVRWRCSCGGSRSRSAAVARLWRAPFGNCRRLGGNLRRPGQMENP